MKLYICQIGDSCQRNITKRWTTSQKVKDMKLMLRLTLLAMFFGLVVSPAYADEYSETIRLFKNAGVADMFESSYGYAIFPTIAKGGFVLGGAYGEGRVYVQKKYFGQTTMTQATIGFQLGGVGFSQVIFFIDKQAVGMFTKGNFEFGAKAQATVLTAAAGASANTAGSSASASGTKDNAVIGRTGYSNGMATFTITKGGLMYEASLGGQKFSFTRK